MSEAGAVTTVTVRILDKEYQVSCPPEEVDELTASARMLDQRMAEIRDAGKVFGLDRIAVMAALNIAHEFLTLRAGQASLEATDAKLVALKERVAQALAEQKRPNT